MTAGGGEVGWFTESLVFFVNPCMLTLTTLSHQIATRECEYPYLRILVTENNLMFWSSKWRQIALVVHAILVGSAS